MIRTRIVLAVAVLALTFAGTATASNWPHAQLDNVATTVAGHPVNVWCESSWADWIHTGDTFGEDWSYLYGFTFQSTPVVYVNPAVCGTLHAMLAGSDVGTFHASVAILALAHESVHQRGVVNEGDTDCTALPLVPGLAADFFGVPRTVTRTRIVRYTRTVVRRLSGRLVRIKVPALRTTQVSIRNPYLDELAASALAWHRSAPPQYQGTC